MQCAVNSSEVSAPVAPKQRAHGRASGVPDSKDVRVSVKLILQNIPNKVVHFIIHTEIFL